MILIPAWILVLLTALVAIDNIVRYREERKLLLLGKVLSWGLASMIYATIEWGGITIDQARMYSRWGWVIVPMTELIYRWAKVRWKL